MRVLLVDDHPVVLAGLAALVEADVDMEVAGATSSVAATRELDLDPPPDVCVVDLQLPDGDGIALGLGLKERWPATRVLILTMSDEPAAVVRSLGAGLDGYVLKDSDPTELVSAIRAVAAGAVVLGAGARAPVVAAASAVPSVDPLAALDARDREVLALLVQGRSTVQVAADLYVSPKTVRNRVALMLGKLGVASRAEAVAIGRASGLAG